MQALRLSLLSLLAAISPLSACAAPIDQLADGSPKPWGPIELQGRTVAPGEKAKFAYSQTGSFESAFLDTIVFVARGALPGPNLCLTALVHGDERNGFEVARQAFAETDATQLAGTLIARPAVNAHGFRTGSRYMTDHRDLNIKIMTSGGVTSFTDPLFAAQYTPEEIAAAVEEATRYGTYVAVHAQTEAGVVAALDVGALSIEHGLILEKKTVAPNPLAGPWRCRE